VYCVCVAILLPVRQVLNPGSWRGYPDKFSWFPQCLLGQMLNKNQNHSHVLPNPSPDCVLLEKLTGTQPTNTPPLMDTEVSLPCSQKPATRPYPKPDASSITPST
jgi:hypothetical protein